MFVSSYCLFEDISLRNSSYAVLGNLQCTIIWSWQFHITFQILCWRNYLETLAFLVDFRFESGTTGGECGSKCKCHSNSLPYCLCGMLPFCQAYSTFSISSVLQVAASLFLRSVLMSLKHILLLFSRKQCLMNTQWGSPWLEVQCSCHCSCFLSSCQKTWLMPYWHATSSFLALLHFRMFSPYGSFCDA